MSTSLRGASRLLALAILALAACLLPQAARADSPASYVTEVTSDQPSHWWRLGEPSGFPTAADSSGGDAPLTYATGVSLGVQGALDFDDDTAAQAASNGVAGTNDWTYAPVSLELWVQVSSSSDQQTLAIGDEGYGHTPDWQLYVLPSGVVESATRIDSWNSSTSDRYADGPASLPVTDGRWHHVVAVFAGTTQTVYVDSTAGPASRVVTHALPCPKNAPCGAQLDPIPFFSVSAGDGGTLDEVATYDHELTSARVAAHFAAAGGSDPLASWEDTQPGPDYESVSPGNDSDAYDPAADTTTSCGAYADFGIADSCLASVVHTDPGTDVAADAVTLNGRVDPDGNEATYYFEWNVAGQTGTTAQQMFDEGAVGDVTVAERLGGLVGNWSLSYRLVARTEGQDWVYGDWQTVNAPAGASGSSGGSSPQVVESTNSAPSAAAALATESADSTSDYTGCGLNAVFWSPNGVRVLEPALAAQNLSCGQYYFAVESSGTVPNVIPACFAGHASWPSNFHAAPVFNWTKWASWVNAPGQNRTWEDAGHLFRDAMISRGCATGDRWFVDELQTRWFGPSVPELTRLRMRRRIALLLRGLFYGNAGAANAKGYVADVVWTQNTANIGIYKPDLKREYSYVNLWKAVDAYTEGWTKEVYTQCHYVCTGATPLALATKRVNPYTFHQRYLAIAAPTTLGTAKSVLADKYIPLLSAAWNSASAAYASVIPLGAMARLIRQQVYSTRYAAGYHYGSHGRISFAWRDPYQASTTNAEDVAHEQKDTAATTHLAQNLAQAIAVAYASGGSANAACTDQDGAGSTYVGCRPLVANTEYNDIWEQFKSW